MGAYDPTPANTTSLDYNNATMSAEGFSDSMSYICDLKHIYIHVPTLDDQVRKTNISELLYNAWSGVGANEIT